MLIGNKNIDVDAAGITTLFGSVIEKPGKQYRRGSIKQNGGVIC